jgi:subtilisin family serine protease
MTVEETNPKLDPGAQIALIRWRRELAREPSRSTEIQASKISLFVEYEGGGEEALRSAGFAVTSVGRGLATGTIDLQRIEELAALPAVRMITRSQPVRPLLDTSVPSIGGTPEWRRAHPDLNGTGVIVGIIDTGIDIFHRHFRTSGEASRILRLWDMNGTVGAGRERPVVGTFQPDYGVEYLREPSPAPSNRVSINRALQLGREAAESAGYTHRDGLRRWNRGHGTRVAAIAAGAGADGDRYPGVAPQADLVVVANKDDDAQILDGVRYIFAVADATSKAAVVNISLGGGLSARDGQEPLERDINALLRATPRGRAVVVAAGNEAEDRTHASADIAPAPGQRTRIFPFTVTRPGAGLALFIDIWYGAWAPLNCRIRKPPAVGFASGRVVHGARPEVSINHGESPVHTVDDSMRLEVSYRPRLANGRTNIRVKASPDVDTGDWDIELTWPDGAPSGSGAHIDVWLFMASSPAARFANPDPFNTIGPPATAANVICVGAYRNTNGELYSLSSRGAQPAHRDGTRRPLPDIVAPGVHIRTARMHNTRHDEHINVSGTSVAAPHVTGVIALMFQANPNLTFEDVKRFLRETARREDIPTTGPNGEAITLETVMGQAFDPYWGFGKLDLAAAVQRAIDRRP